METNGELRDEAVRIVRAAAAAGLTVRLAGSAACLVHAPSAERLYERAGRRVRDVDLVTVSRVKANEVEGLLAGLGYEPLAHHNIWHAETRQMFERPDGVHVDVFRNALDFNHTVPLKGRLEVDDPTIPLAELLLTKLQIVEVNEKDLQDIVALVLDHGLGAAPDEIDAGRIGELLAGDWGFWYTATGNLAKARSYLERAGIEAPEREAVAARLDELEARIEAEPKSARWKMRARVGPRKRWYQEVEEAQR